MKRIFDFVNNSFARIFAILIIVIFFFLAQQPYITESEGDELAKQFHFEQFFLPEDAHSNRQIRDVAPNLHNISSWVSATGAGVALTDLDNDNLSNDMCKVDPRTDGVLVAPVPSTGDRFVPFKLEAANLIDRQTMAPMGCIPNDYNEDGITDLLVYYWGRTPLLFLAKNRNHQPFSPTASDYIPQETVVGGARWFSGAATVADLDGDGHLDIVVGNYYQDEAEILNPNTRNEQSMQHSMSRASNGGRSRILRWRSSAVGQNPSVSYEVIEDYLDNVSASEKTEIYHGWALAVGACDLDGDMLPELYFGNDFGRDHLLHNRSSPGQIRFTPIVGKKGLTTPSSKIVGRDSYKGMGVDFADINKDSNFDFYVSNIADEYALEESHFLFVSNGKLDEMRHGTAPYVDESEKLGVSRSGWGWDVKFGDFNNDGTHEIIQATGFLKGEKNLWPELHEIAMGNDQLLSNPNNWHKVQPGADLSGHNRNPFFVRASDGRFYDLAAKIGLDVPQVSRSIATADVDGDGRLDFAVANQWDHSFFYLNKSPTTAPSLGLRLRLPLDDTADFAIHTGANTPSVASRPAIGAVVHIETLDEQKQISFVDGGNGHAGKRSSDLHFGLGELSPNEQVKIKVRWRDIGGYVRQHAFELTPGLHTILLGNV